MTRWVRIRCLAFLTGILTASGGFPQELQVLLLSLTESLYPSPSEDTVCPCRPGPWHLHFQGSVHKAALAWGRPTKQGSDRVPPTAGLLRLIGVDKHRLGVRERSWISGRGGSPSPEVRGHPAVWVAAFLGGLSFPQGLWEKCQLLKTASVFARCHALVDPEPFVALCERMLCACAQGLRCPCPVLLEYARACAQQGMLLYGWADHSSCRESARGPHLPPGWVGPVLGVPPQVAGAD